MFEYEYIKIIDIRQFLAILFVNNNYKLYFLLVTKLKKFIAKFLNSTLNFNNLQKISEKLQITVFIDWMQRHNIKLFLIF